MEMATVTNNISTISYRGTWAEISLDAIYRNTSLFKNRISNHCRLMAVVKADGYGHGSIEIAKTALQAGADYLGVAFLDEALVLRESGINAPILVLGFTPPESVKKAIQKDITITVFTEEVLKQVIVDAESLLKEAIIHLKVDTGMGRIGVATKEEALKLAQQAMAADFVTVEGIFTHFSDADGEEESYTIHQFNQFKTVLDHLEMNQVTIPIKHCCNSAGATRFPSMHLDMVRVGVSLYGLHPSDVTKKLGLPLEQAFTFKTKIAAIKKVQKDLDISYGRTYTTDQETVIATVPVGYADGVSRKLSNKGYVLIHHQRAPIIGRVCMDQMMIDITSIDAQIDDEVILFGGSEHSFISVAEIAAWMETIHYEVVCLIGKRVPRVYVQKGEMIGYRNSLRTKAQAP